MPGALSAGIALRLAPGNLWTPRRIYSIRSMGKAASLQRSCHLRTYEYTYVYERVCGKWGALNERELTIYRRGLAERLREDAEELEDYVFDRIRALEERSNPQRHRSLEGIRGLIKPLIEYACVVIEDGKEPCPAPPPAVIAHARSAAWGPLSTRILQQHYLNAYTVFKRYLRNESRHLQDHSEAALSRVLESTDIVFERLFAAVGEEHERTLKERGRSREAGRLERVEELLAGELVGASGLDYDFEATHMGIVGTGAELGAHVKRVARSFDGRLLLVQASPQKTWAWISTRRKSSTSELEEHLLAGVPPPARISLGETASGLAGWRRTHREAAEALGAAYWLDRTVVRYGKVQFLAAMLRNELLKASIEERYLSPLTSARARGGDLLRTLRAYFAANRNGRSAAAALKVSPQTVTNHLKRVEERLESPLPECGMGLEAALLLADGLAFHDRK